MLSINGLVISKNVLRGILGARTNELIGKLTLVHRRRIGAPIITKVYSRMQLTIFCQDRWRSTSANSLRLQYDCLMKSKSILGKCQNFIHIRK